MSSQKKPSNSLYPEVILSNPETVPVSSTSSSSLYPSIDVKDMAENLYPEENDADSNIANCPPPSEQVLVKITGGYSPPDRERKERRASLR
ncbi:hypothetical protein Dsin_025446 [Dipteronia sinensis]|uniref:Uncharacterized protein n=1 Tax=Dipteronia sinensis TaxID=43782 RepID=A0AAD9ZWE9_9ROSI|nr:hypothetical protein Dsin_025446 [Dipteronia sinensis]